MSPEWTLFYEQNKTCSVTEKNILLYNQNKSYRIAKIIPTL